MITVSISGSPLLGNTLSAQVLASSEVDLNGLNYQWSVGNQPLAGAHQSSLLLTESLVGSFIQLTVTNPATEESVEAALQDQVGFAVTLSGIAQQGHTLTATHGFTQLSGYSLQYTWWADDQVLIENGPASLTLGQDQVGKQLRVEVWWRRADNVNLWSASPASTAVLNTNDSPVGDVVIEGKLEQGSTLSMTLPHGLSDADGMSQADILHQWLVNGSVLESATGDTLYLSQDLVDQKIAARLIYTDDLGTTETLTSPVTNAVSNVNDSPTGLPLITGKPAQFEHLGVSLATLGDADLSGSYKTPTAVTYQWFLNGVAIKGATESTWTPTTQSMVGQSASVEVTYTDHWGTTETRMSELSDPIDNANDPVTGAITIKGFFSQTNTLTADTSALVDPDEFGDFNYEWFADDISLQSSPDATLVLKQSAVNKRITVKVSYLDGRGFAESVTSQPTKLIANANDAPTGEVLITGQFVQGKTLQIDGSNIDDPDGLGSFSYQWYRSKAGIETLIPGATLSSLVLQQADVDSALFAKVSYTDAWGTKETLTSALSMPVEDVNDPPTGHVQISGTASVGRTLSILNTLVDADGYSSNSLEYQWLSDGKNIDGATDSTLVLSPDLAQHAVSVRVNYWDNQSHYEGITSDAVTVTGSSSTPAVAKFWKDSSKTVNNNKISNAVSLTDAIAILKMVVGVNVNANKAPLSPYQVLAADYDQNGLITLSDAIGVLKKVVGISSAVQPSWKYYDASLVQSTVTSAQILKPKDWTGSAMIADPTQVDSSVQVVGVLTGDVDGSWTGL